MITSRILVASRGDALGRAVRAAMGPGGQTVNCPHLDELDRTVEMDGPFDVVVAGPALDNRAGMQRLASLRSAHPELGLVLALPDRPRSTLRDIVRTGAVDVVGYPAVDPRALGRALHAAHRHAVRMAEHHGHTESDELTEAMPVMGTVLTVASSTGGCGKTFYATNLAYHLARMTGQRVCLVDLDLQFGEVSTALRLKPRFSVADALAGDVDDQDLHEHVEEFMTPHPAGFHVLTAPRDPSEADHIDPPRVIQVVRALKRRFDYVVVDTPAQLSETVLAAFDQSSRLLVLATFDLPSVRNTTVFLKTLEKLKIPTDDISVILNKVESGVGMEVDEVNEVLDHRIESTLVYAKEVSRSINRGEPVIACAPHADISRQLVASMQRWTPAVPVATVPGGAHSAAARSAPARAAGAVSDLVARRRRLFHRRRTFSAEVAVS